ncbi:MAG: hypothetical protein IT372_38525, partial [Polyangiaceae bacterium]|nr:hypothetical protein [Polyangiaceae bacterium]
WGGAGFGGTNLPRVGQEVIVDFLGGDPDRPVIVGRVYTNLQKTPYVLPDNKTQSGWRSSSTNGTGGYNEIMFEDKAGSELVRMQAEKDLHKLVKHDEEIEIRNDRSKRIKRDEHVQIDRDRTKKIDRDEHVEIGQSRSKKIGKDEQVEIGGNHTSQVAQNKSSSVGQNLLSQVLGNVQEMVGSSHTRLVGLNHSLTVGASSTKQVGLIDSTVVGQVKVVSISPPGEAGPPAPDATHYIMQDGKFHFDDGKGASITIEQGKITLEAKNGIAITAASGDVVVKGTPKVKLNP